MSRKFQFSLWQVFWFLALVCLGASISRWQGLPTPFSALLIGAVAVLSAAALTAYKRRVIRLIRVMAGKPDRGIVIRGRRTK